MTESCYRRFMTGSCDCDPECTEEEPNDAC